MNLPTAAEARRRAKGEVPESVVDAINDAIDNGKFQVPVPELRPQEVKILQSKGYVVRGTHRKGENIIDWSLM